MTQHERICSTCGTDVDSAHHSVWASDYHVPVPRRMTPDTIRVVEWFRAHPGSTVNEAKVALWLHITARMSDARKEGVVFDQVTSRVNGRRVVRFSVAGERERVTRGEQVGMAL